MCHFYVGDVYTVVLIFLYASFEITCQVNDSKISELTTLELLKPLILQDETNRTYLSLDIKLGIWVSINNQSVILKRPEPSNNITINAIDGYKIKQMLDDSLHYLKTSFSDLWSKVSESVKDNKFKRFNSESATNASHVVREISAELKRQNKININNLPNLSSSAENKYSDVEEIIKQLYQMKTGKPVSSVEAISFKGTNEYFTSESTVTRIMNNMDHLNLNTNQRMQLKNFLLKKMLQRQRGLPTPTVVNDVSDISAPPYSAPPILTRRLMRPYFDSAYAQDDRENNLLRFRRMNKHDWILKPVLEREIAEGPKVHYNKHNADTKYSLDHREAEYDGNYDHVVYTENENVLHNGENSDSEINENGVLDREGSAQIVKENGTDYYSSADALST